MASNQDDDYSGVFWKNEKKIEFLGEYQNPSIPPHQLFSNFFFAWNDDKSLKEAYNTILLLQSYREWRNEEFNSPFIFLKCVITFLWVHTRYVGLRIWYIGNFGIYRYNLLTKIFDTTKISSTS